MKYISIIWTIVLLAVGLSVSWIGVGLFRRWSLGRELLDVPNERSSHTAPVPRGGGAIIVVACLVGYALISLIFNTPFSIGYFTGALLVALVSWLDDLYSLEFWKRLIVHFAAAGILVFDLGGWQTIGLPLTAFEIGLGPVFGPALAVAWIVWLLNAYNFMDGIDGIAALQAITAGVGWGLIGIVLGLEGLFLFASLFSAVAAGFLVHNWPPARIFMGDVGSAFLGFTLAAMPLLARNETGIDTPLLPLVGLAFVWLFVFDTIFTLIRRIINRERVWEAHRGHLYQRMVIGGRSHRAVTLGYGAAAAVITSLTLLAIIFGGNYILLTISFLLILTGCQVYLGARKKR